MKNLFQDCNFLGNFFQSFQQFPLFQNSNLILFPIHIICIDQEKYVIKRINIIISFKIAIYFYSNAIKNINYRTIITVLLLKL